MPLDANHDNTFRRSAMKAELLDAETEITATRPLCTA
jgi:hypothetical protein